MATPAAIRIGIPLCLDAAQRIRAGRRTHYIDVRYAEALCAAGATPIYLPAPARARDLLAGVDALLVPGGDDFPSPAPLPAAARLDPAAPEQIAFDSALLEEALARGMPVLGICYGMQLLALAHGGTLIYDLPTQRQDARPHQLPESGTHALDVASGSRLEGLLGPRPAPVNSLHHQAVDDPGRLAAVAWAEDGIVEAVEARASGPLILGVQWHPEKLPAAERARFFEGFVSACRTGTRG